MILSDFKARIVLRSPCLRLQRMKKRKRIILKYKRRKHGGRFYVLVGIFSFNNISTIDSFVYFHMLVKTFKRKQNQT